MTAEGPVSPRARSKSAALNVAILQGPAEGGEKPRQLAALEEAAKAAARTGARLLVAPELFLTGYNIGADALRELAEPEDGPSAAQAAIIARRHGVALLYGYPERSPDGRLYNSALLLGPDGEPLANHRKLHLFGDMERAVFTPGTRPWTLASLDGMRVGILICYDVEFPEMVRGLALRGADLVAVPTALMRPYDFVARILVRARAYESQVFLAYANRTGTEGALTYVGESCIASPDGTDLARADAGERLISASLDLAMLAQSRSLYPYLQDRMPAHYGGDPGA